MNEKLICVQVGKETYPLLYSLAANAEFDEHYMDKVDDVDDLMTYFIGPQDVLPDKENGIAGDTPEELERKAQERKNAHVFFKRELPWLIATLAKHGLKAAAKAGEKKLPDPPTVEQLADAGWPAQQGDMISAVHKAMLYGQMIEHKGNPNEEVDVVLTLLRAEQAKNVKGAAG